MRRSRYLTIALFIFSTISAASASQCSDRHLEEFNSQGGKDAWLKRVRSMQNQAKQALRTGVWSDGKKISKENLQQIRDGIQVLEEDIAEASACSLPGQSARTSPSTRGNQPASAASNCPKEIRIKYPTDQFGNFVDDTYRYIGGKDYEQVIHTPTKTETYKNTFGKDLAARVEDAERDMSWLPELRKLAEWGRCHLAALEGNHSSAASANASAASAQSGPNLGNASEANGQRSNRKNVLNPSSPQGSSAQSQSRPSDGECKNGDPSCAIKGCNRSGGKAITYRNNAGCGVVSCRFADTKNDWSSVYNNIPGSGCMGSTK